MWVPPRPTTALYAFWNVLEETDWFLLVEHKAVVRTGVLGAVFSVVRKVGSTARDSLVGSSTASQPQRYRIVLKDGQHHMLSVAGCGTPPLRLIIVLIQKLFGVSSKCR